MNQAKIASKNQLIGPLGDSAGWGVSSRTITSVFAAITLALTALIAYLGWRCYISDSEIWSVTLGYHFIEDIGHSWVATRAGFYALVHLATLFARDGSEALLFARFLCIANAVMIIALVVRAGRKLCHEPWVPWFAAAFLCTNTSFVNQAFRIRSDLFVSSFSLLLLNVLLECRPISAKPIALWAILPAFTPKAVIQQGVFFFAWAPLKRIAGYFRRPLVLTGLILFTAVVASAFFIPAHPLALLYGPSFSYFLRTYSGQYYPSGLSAIGFYYFLRLLRQNPILIAFLLARTVTLVARIRHKDFASRDELRIHSHFSVFVAFEVVWLCFAGEKLPFFIASILPFLCLYGALLFDDALILLKRGRTWIISVALLTVLALSAQAVFFASLNLAENSNQGQITAVKILDDYLSRYPGRVMLDAIGVVPTRANYRRFLGPNEPDKNLGLMTAATDDLPDFIFYTAKMSFVEPKMSALLESHYFHYGNGLYALAFGKDRYIPLTLGEIILATKALSEYSKSRGFSYEGDILIALERPEGGLRYLPVKWKNLKPEFISELKKEFGDAKIRGYSPYFPPETQIPEPLNKLFKFDNDF